MDFKTYPGLKDAYDRTGLFGLREQPQKVDQEFIDILPKNGRVLAVAGTYTRWWFLTEDSIIIGLGITLNNKIQSDRVPLRTVTGIEIKKNMMSWQLRMTRANNIDELPGLKTEQVAKQFADAVNDQIAAIQSNNGGSKSESSLDKIKKLQELLEAGAITKKEFGEAKAKLLSDI